MTEKKGSLDAFADARDEAKFDENQALARTLRTVRASLGDTKKELAEALAQAGAAENALDLFKRNWDDKPKWLVPPKGAGAADRGTLLAEFSDAHYSEVVAPGEVGGYNAYNLEIAAQRTERFFRRVVKVARSYFAGVKYDGIVLALNGDLVSGDIHAELEQTNEVSTNRTILFAVPLIAEGCEILRKEFGAVHVVSSPGNHGRDSKQPRYKRRSEHNADTLIAGLVAREMGKSGDVTFTIPESLDAVFKIYGFTFALEHGEELARSFSGSPEIGSLGPLMRGTNRKKVALAAEGVNLDYALWAHFHQLIPLPGRGFIANGSLKGYDEFARGLKLRPEPPQQYLGVVDPKYGITTSAPIFVADRAAEKW